MNAIKGLLVASIVCSSTLIAACSGSLKGTYKTKRTTIEGTITWAEPGRATLAQLKTLSGAADWKNIDSGTAARVMASAANAAASGNDVMSMVMSEADAVAATQALLSGFTTPASFAQVTQLTGGASVASVSGVVLTELQTQGSTVAATTFSYHVSGPYLVFDNPGAVDQWILSKASLHAETLQVSISDFMINSRSATTDVTFGSAVLLADVQVAQAQTTYRPAGRTCSRPPCGQIP